MAFDINLYNYSGEPNRLDKTLGGTTLTLTGTLKEGADVINPVIEFYDVGGTTLNLDDYNYMYIGAFGRYYFITDIIVDRTNVVFISGHVDVLNTYKNDIKNLQAMATRSEYEYNAYITDPTLPTYQYDDCDVVFWGKANEPSKFTYTSDYVIMTTMG